MEKHRSKKKGRVRNEEVHISRSLSWPGAFRPACGGASPTSYVRPILDVPAGPDDALQEQPHQPHLLSKEVYLYDK
jgi:hypothetical protein